MAIIAKIEDAVELLYRRGIKPSQILLSQNDLALLAASVPAEQAMSIFSFDSNGIGYMKVRGHNLMVIAMNTSEPVQILGSDLHDDFKKTLKKKFKNGN